MSKSFKELIKYGIVGIIGLGVDFLFFIIFRDLCGMPYWLAHPLGSIIAILNNFLLNSYFTFKTTDKMIKRSASFFGIAGIGLVISSLLLPWGVRIYNVYLHDFINIANPKTVEDISKIGATLFVAFLQFFANKYLTFKKKKAEETDQQ